MKPSNDNDARSVTRIRDQAIALFFVPILIATEFRQRRRLVLL